MMIAETYETPDGVARRFWAIPGRLLIGGTILDAKDGAHLSVAYGVTHVLSVEEEHDDEGKFPAPRRARFPFPDSESYPAPIRAETVLACVLYAEKVLIRLSGRLYLHCLIGGARSPAISYALALALGEQLGVDHERFWNELKAVGCNLRHEFIASITQALARSEYRR